MVILKNNNGLNELKDMGILSDWVSTIPIAEKFIFNEFSSNNKKWKVSRNETMTEFQIIHNRGLLPISSGFYTGFPHL